ncbi:MAG: hypothetical protein VKI63_04885 [Cyanobium sp.]|nr:hypothetical protein [Cyanobium sp.]
MRLEPFELQGSMAWDPNVLRRFNTTSHYRLLGQLRDELKSNPLVRPAEGERIGDVNRSKQLIRAIAARQGLSGRIRGTGRSGGNR